MKGLAAGQRWQHPGQWLYLLFAIIKLFLRVFLTKACKTLVEFNLREAASTGIDVFRVFDALNDVEQMRPAIEAVRDTGTAVAEVALCYTSDLDDPAERVYTLDYYLHLAERSVEAGAHVLAIKDMAGLLRAPAARRLVTALRERFELPVHLHTHDTTGGQLATLLAAAEAEFVQWRNY